MPRPTAPPTPTAAGPSMEAWSQRRCLGAVVRRLIAELDPVESDAEIVHLSSEVLTPPVLAHFGYSSAAVRNVAVPRVADRLARSGTGLQLRQPWQRDARTLRVFSAMMRVGHHSRECADLCARVQGVHRGVGGVLPEDQLYTLATLITYPDALSASMGHAFYSGHERTARRVFWTGVGTLMGLAEIPQTDAEWEHWMADYEGRLFAPSHDAHLVAEAHVRALTRWFPPGAAPLVRSILSTTLGDTVRRCVGYPESPALSTTMQHALWRLTSALCDVRPVRLSATWADAFPDRGPALGRGWKEFGEKQTSEEQLQRETDQEHAA